MEFSNKERWLLTLKDGDVSFDGIKETINHLQESTNFDYEKSLGKHAIFHMILNDLDALCQKGEAERTFERLSEAEVSEVFRITPVGKKKAKNLLLKGQEHQK